MVVDATTNDPRRTMNDMEALMGTNRKKRLAVLAGVLVLLYLILWKVILPAGLERAIPLVEDTAGEYLNGQLQMETMEVGPDLTFTARNLRLADQGGKLVAEVPALSLHLDPLKLLTGSGTLGMVSRITLEGPRLFLVQDERQEWNSIYASYRGRSALTGTIIGIDPYSVRVRNPETGEMEKQTMYCAIVVPYRVRIVIPATEMWEQGRERPEFVMQNMVGSSIDFIIIKVDRESGFAIGSRRLALRARRYYFAHRPNLNAIGTRLKCRVMAVGPRRCLVEFYGHDINLTQREIRYTSIPDLRDEYHPGQELECIVKVYDPDTDRVEISVKETESNPYDGAEQRHPIGSRRQAMIAGKYGGGVFCNLPDGTVCMCNYSYQHEDSDFLVGDTVILVVQRYAEEKKQMYGKILSKW